VKIIILKNNLKSALDIVGRAIGQNLNLPVLGSVLIKAENNQIQLAATNLELAITKNVFGKVVEEGVIIVPYNTLATTVNNIASERINLEKTKNGTLELKTDNYTAIIQTVDDKEFPIIPKISGDVGEVEIKAQTLKDSLSKIVIAGEASDLRPEIGGVLFIGETAELKLVATDSFRLAEASIHGGQIKSKEKNSFKATIPLKTAQEITRIIGEDEFTKLSIGKNQAVFETDDTTVTTRLIEGEFPDYKAIIPESIETKITAKREEFINALKLTSTFASKTNDVNIKTKDNKLIEVYSSDSAIGENRYLIPAKIEGPDTEAIFSWKYLLDGVRAGSSKEIFIGLNGSDKPAIIKDPNDETYFYILMPIKPN